MRRLLALCVAALSMVPPPAAGAGAKAVPVVVLDGRGWGHGVGMAQDGALWMGRGGSSTAQILAHFYPGTRSNRGGGTVRVAVWGGGSETVLAFPQGGEVRDAPGSSSASGFPLSVPPGGQVRVRFDGGRFIAEPAGGGPRRRLGGPGARSSVRGRGAGGAGAGGSGAVARFGGQAPPAAATTTTTVPLLELPASVPAPGTPVVAPPTAPATAPPATAPPPPATRPASSPRPLWAVPSAGGTVGVVARGNRYRGTIEVGSAGAGLRLVNHVDVEQYLRGMGEVRDPSWPAASLRAQAIAARTYALRAVAGGGELCDTQLCQVYLGAQAEYAAMDRAVAATRGQVLYFGRALAATVYSANAGGTSATPEEGFGTANAGYPYLRAAPYPTRDPLAWTVRVALRDVGRRLGYRGTVTGVRVSAGPSGRAVRVTLDGASGSRAVAGNDFRRALGLRSNLFSARVELSDVAPPPPPPADTGPVQSLPGESPPADEAGVAPPAGHAGDGAGAAGRIPPGTALARSTSPGGAAKAVLGMLAWLLLIVVGALATVTRGAHRRARPGPG